LHQSNPKLYIADKNLKERYSMNLPAQASEENKSERLKKLEKERLPVVNSGDGKKIIGWFHFHDYLTEAWRQGKKSFAWRNGWSAKVIVLEAKKMEYGRLAYIATMEKQIKIACNEIITVCRDGTVRCYKERPVAIHYTAEERLIIEQQRARRELPATVADAVAEALVLEADLHSPIVFSPASRRKFIPGKRPTLTLVVDN
jgi:hypothetical protein